jgi:hypothetical protein
MSKREPSGTPLAVAPLPRSPSLAAERMRRYRRRRRNGLRSLTVELRETEIETLIRKGLLKADARNDPHAIREALHAHFDHTLSVIP